MNSIIETNPRVEDLSVGSVLQERLVTDTILWMVVKKTAKSVTIRLMQSTNEGFGEYPNRYTVVVPSTHGTERVVRNRKGGGVRLNSWSNTHHVAPFRLPNGNMGFVRYTDYSF